MKKSRAVIVGVVAIGAIACIGCASEDTQPQPESPTLARETVAENTDEARTEPSDDLVCRTERVTGSHMHRRRCYTASELDEMQESSRDWLRTRGVSGGPVPVRDPADPRETDRP